MKFYHLSSFWYQVWFENQIFTFIKLCFIILNSLSLACCIQMPQFFSLLWNWKFMQILRLGQYLHLSVYCTKPHIIGRFTFFSVYLNLRSSWMLVPLSLPPCFTMTYSKCLFADINQHQLQICLKKWLYSSACEKEDKPTELPTTFIIILSHKHRMNAT